MRSLPVMEVRKHLGEVLDQVRLKCETVIIERAGRPMAKLCPLSGKTADTDDAAIRLRALEQLVGMGGPTARGSAVEEWLDAERSSWDDRK